MQRKLFRAVLVLACLGAASAATEAMTTNVVFRDFSFTPKSVTIQVGDTVVWTNAGGGHTVTGDGADPICGSGTIPVSCSHTFTQAGTFPYHCIPHASFGMVGTVIVMPAANIPPTVSIVSPANNTTLAAPGAVTIQATAAPENTIAQVEFFDGTTSLGVDTASPFSVDANLAAGTHTLTAKATDKNGLSTTSDAVSVVVNAAPPPPASGYVQHNFVSDQAGVADRVDPNLLNAWGIAFSPTGPFWVADNHSGLSTVYNSAGEIRPLVVQIPGPAGAQGPGAPTGLVFNNTPDFLLENGKSAVFIFATEDGTIAAWNEGTNAVLKANNSTSQAIYKGLAIGNSGGKNYLYATDFHNGKIDVFSPDFSAATLPGTFSDPNIPAGFAPFNVQNLDGNLYVTFAKQDDDKEDDVPGAGNGFVDVFDTAGNMVKRLLSNGPLNSPWGLAVAPSTFAPFAGALLIGNFGDGTINAFNLADGAVLGKLQQDNGTPIAIEGLWGLTFGNGGQGGNRNILYFTAGPGDEEHGAFGSITPTALVQITAFQPATNGVTLSWTGGTPPFLLQQKFNVDDRTWMNVMTTTNTTATVARVGQAGFFRVSDKATTSVTQFTVSLSGAAERPDPVTSDGTGFGTILIEGNTLTYNITFSGLSGPAIAAHIHGPAEENEAVGVIKALNFPTETSGVMSGTIDLTTLTADQVNAIKAGHAYVNIHTAAHQGGEIRGQLTLP